MDVVVTVPMAQWQDWLDEGDLPGEVALFESHFWVWPPPRPESVRPGDRVYVVSHNRLRGYAPLIRVENPCTLDPYRACLLRHGDAVAVTIPTPIRGFQGWRKRWWNREDEVPFSDWMTADVR